MAPKRKKGPSFEESLKLIDEEIQKRMGRWNLKSITYMDFEDVSQIIKLHIFNKWSQYDPSKPLSPWLNRIITNQLKNIIRNNYSNFTRPCLKCAAAQEPDGCAIYIKQCEACPLFAHWSKAKKDAHYLKHAAPLEYHSFDLEQKESGIDNFESNKEKLDSKMKEVLKPLEWKVYSYLYIENLSEKEAAKLVGYKTSEPHRTPGYKQIKNIRKKIIDKVKKILGKGDVDIF